MENCKQRDYFRGAGCLPHELENDMEDWDNYSADVDYTAQGIEEPSAPSLPFILNIKNTSTDDISNVVFLGANSNSWFPLGIIPNFGNSEFINITMENGTVTYQEFLDSIKSQPFEIGMMHLQSDNPLQPFKTLRLFFRESSGWEFDEPINPALDPMQEQAGVTIVRKKFPVNAYTEIRTTILANSELRVMMYPTEQLDLARTLVGRPVAKDYSKPDLSQFQLPSRDALVG